MRTACLIIVLAIMVASCGVKRPLMRPSEIPAYEEKLRKKRESLEQDKRELERIDAERASGATP